MTPLKITVFGMPRMEHAGNALDISRRKVVALAAYLAVTGQPQSRDTLAALLWPEYDQASARSNLRRDLSRLKRLMGGEHLKVERNQVELVQGPGLWLDVSEFEKALSQIREHHPEARQLCETCATVLAEAVALYQDDFLAGFAVPDSAAFDEWQFFRREELRQALAGALQRLIDWHVASGQVDRGIGYGRRWVALDPLHEPAQRRLMQLYAWSGQQSAALRQYQESVRLLREELGVEPEEETIALYEAIRSRQLTAPRSRTGPKDRKAEGRYELLDLLAVGGHAEVYYGRDRENQADVVIKRLKPELLVRDPIYLERFIREATALSQLEHPNIVRMLATFEEDGQHSIVMEYVPGGSLRQLLDREGPLPIPQALAIALELADALARAHHLNIIHRDLKPDNVLLGANGAPRLTDFGLARLRRDDGRLTRTGTVLGSPAYMSPEALRGETLDARSDIWSFGVLLYEMIAGRKPFDGEQLTPVLVSILQDEAPPVTVFRAAAPPALAALLQQLLQKERALRPPSMRQVAAQLEAIAVGSALLPADTDEKSAPAKLSREALPNSPPRQAAQEARAEPPPHGLPIPRSPLVGRQREVGELCSLLAQGQGQRLVTLVGPGGMGKTRLALAVAAEMAPSFADGVFFVPLAALTTADQLVTAIAESTGLRFVGNDAFDRQLMNYLRQRRALLLLDNFDHVLDGLPLVAALLEKAPELCLLVTSRERLNLAGEQVYTLHGLPFPAVGSGVQEEDAGSYGAVQLLVQQAQRQMPGYTPDGKELAAAARIAQLVEGMPLPLLLAASWLSLLSFAEIAGEISADIDFLASEARDLPPRQRSMRAVFEGSWERLEEDEREIVVKLSAFHGVFDRAAAEAVAGATPRGLRGLLQKSWIQRTDEGQFHIHELLRQYAARKLQEDGQSWEAVQQRHAAYFARLLADQFIQMRGPAQNEAYATVAANFGHIRQAWRRLLEEDAFEVIATQMLPALFRYCETRVESLALTQLLETTLEALRAAGEGGDDVVRAILLTATGAYFRNVYPARFESYGMIVPAHEEAVREAWALAQQAGGLNSVYWNALLGYIYGRIVDRDAGLRYVRGLLPGLTREQAPWQRAFALHLLALLLMLQTPEMEEEDAAEAQAALEEALALFEMGGDLRETGHSRRALGQLHRLKREFSQAIGCWMLARSQLEAAGESAIAGDIYMQIGDAYLQLGQIEEAFPHYRRMSEAHLRSGNERMAAMVLSKESYEAARFGNLEHARQTREQALALAQRTGDLFTEAWCRWEMGELLRLSGEPAQARDWYEQSRALFEQFGDKAGIAFYYRGLGDLALGAGDYEEAAQAFARSVARVQTSANAWAMAYALAGSGIAALKLQQPDEARRHLAGALQSVQEAGDAGIALRVLAAAALLCDALGRRDLAAETSALVWRHPIAWVESKAMVAALHQANEQAGAHAPDPLTDTGVERRQQDLWQMVERVSRALA